MNLMRHYLSYVLPLSFLIAVALGSSPGLWVPALLTFVVVPALDPVIGEDRRNTAAREISPLTARLLAFAPAGFVLLHVASVVAGAMWIATTERTIDLLACLLSVGVIGGISISAAHELIHKKCRRQKMIGRLGLLAVAYLHFETHHLYGHHRNACTDKDPSTAAYGENIYRFLMRTIPDCFLFSWRHEELRLAARGSGFWTLTNRMLWCIVLPLSFAGGTYAIGGFRGVLLYAAQAFFAIVMLEIVSYIEHYGLRRETRSDGTIRRMESHHSWDSYFILSGCMSFMLQRHADHHTIATRPYALLESHDAAPTLPAGYQTMISVALVPPLWRRIMHPRLGPVAVTSTPVVPGPAHRHAIISHDPEERHRPARRLAPG